MKKLLLLIIAGLVLVSCGERIKGIKTVPTEGDAKVQKLFTVDGVSVYRFHDGLNVIYFTTRGDVTKIHHTEDGDEITRTIGGE